MKLSIWWRIRHPFSQRALEGKVTGYKITFLSYNGVILAENVFQAADDVPRTWEDVFALGKSVLGMVHIETATLINASDGGCWRGAISHIDLDHLIPIGTLAYCVFCRKCGEAGSWKLCP